MSMPPTTMSGQLWGLCEHGEAKMHILGRYQQEVKASDGELVLEMVDVTCPGGHPVEGGEVIKWCLEHRMPQVAVMLGEAICREVYSYRPADAKHCRMVERFLIPLPNTETEK